MIDTARILIDWKCNLRCSYCCNDQERFRKNIQPVHIDNIDYKKYKFFCISGGEPLLNIGKLIQTLVKVPEHGFVILYTNGILLDEYNMAFLAYLGVNAINVGLHQPSSFKKIISNCLKVSKSYPAISIRFQLWDKYKDFGLELLYPTAKFKYWTMNDCERDNEDRFILVEE